MRKEKIKTVTLSSLVIISLVLTYSLWSYQPAFEVIQNPNYVQDVSIGAKQNYKDIVAPNQLVVHASNSHYISTYQNNILPLYKALQKTDISNLKNLTNDLSIESYQSMTKGNNKLELIFPTLVPTETLSKILKIDAKRFENVLFDRIILDLSQKKETSIIYFVNETSHVIYEGKIDNTYIRSSLDKIKNSYQHYTKGFKFKLDTGKVIYLPEGSTSLKTVEFLTSDISVDKLKDAIFIDPSNVRNETSESGETYTDGTRLMTISPLNRSVSFVNPTTVESGNQTPDVLVQRSTDFINGHGGWTDRYLLSSIKTDSNEVSFRLYINNLPVYKNATISTKWGKDDLQTFKRPLYKLGIQVEKKENQIELMSGHEIIDIIRNNKSLNKSLVKDITIGYETIYNGDEANQSYYNRAIQMKPVWIIHYGDTYKKIDEDLLSRTGVNIVGLE